MTDTSDAMDVSEAAGKCAKENCSSKATHGEYGGPAKFCCPCSTSAMVQLVLPEKRPRPPSKKALAGADGVSDDEKSEEPAKKSSRGGDGGGRGRGGRGGGSGGRGRGGRGGGSGGRGSSQPKVSVAAAETTVESTVEASAETTVDTSVEGVVGDIGDDGGCDGAEDFGGDGGYDSAGDFGDDGGDGGGGDIGRGRGPDKAPRKARQGGAKIMYSTEIISRLSHAFDDEMREHIDGCRDEAGLEAIHYEGTCERASNEPSGIISLQLKAKLLTGGLCDASTPDSLKLTDDVGFKRSELPGLKYYFDKNYMFDPASIEVDLELGLTRVKVDGKNFVVNSFDHGKYTLSGHNPITQWELLQNRCDGGVTLDDELRRFIIQQMSDYLVLMATVVPYFYNCGIATDGMLWNIKDAVERARVHPDRIDVQSNNMTFEELTSLREERDTMHRLSLQVFTTLPLSETLPKNFWDGGAGGAVDESLRGFADESGSLSQLNCLRGLGCVSKKGIAEGCLFTEDVVGGSHSIAPEHDRPRGTWDEKLRSVSRLLTCAYRLRRPVSLVEAYIPLCEAECATLNAHHRLWKGNIAHSLKGLHEGLAEGVGVKDSELTGEKSCALRFAMYRSTEFLSAMPPVVVGGCGTRDSEKYGRVGLDSLDISHFNHARAGPGILQKLLGTDSSADAVDRIVSVQVENFFQKVRNNREYAAAKTSGGVGTGSKERKQRIALVMDEWVRRYLKVRKFMEALDVNGCQRIMDTIEKIDPGITDFLLKRLEGAETVSTTWEANHIIGEDHLLGKTPDEIAEGKRRVAALLVALRELPDEKKISEKDFVVFGVAMQLGMLINGASIRPQDFFFLLFKTMYYKDSRMMIRLPEEGKQTRTAVKKKSMVCMEHEVEGDDVVRWMAVFALVGRPFLQEANDGEELSPYFTALGVDGQALSQGVFGTILTGVGAAFFGLENLDVNGFRTCQDTLAVEMILELGWKEDDHALKELARQQRTSLHNVTNIYNSMRYDITSVARNTTISFVSFKGGIRRMLEARLGWLGIGDGSATTPCATSSLKPSAHEFVDGPFLRLKRDLLMARMQEELDELREAKAKRDGTWAGTDATPPVCVRCLAAPAPVATIPGPTTAGATAWKRGPYAIKATGAGPQKTWKRGPYNKTKAVKAAPPPTTPAEREMVQEVVMAIGEAFKRAEDRGKEDPVYHYMTRPSYSVGVWSMVKRLRDRDAVDFRPGLKFEASRYATMVKGDAFETLVRRVEADVDDFEWMSWQSYGR